MARFKRNQPLPKGDGGILQVQRSSDITLFLIHTKHANPERIDTRKGRAAAKSVSSADKSRDSPSPPY